MVESWKQKKQSDKHVAYHQLDTTIRQLWSWTLLKIRQKMHKKSVENGCQVWSAQTNKRILPSEKAFCQATEAEDEASVDKENWVEMKSFCLAFYVFLLWIKNEWVERTLLYFLKGRSELGWLISKKGWFLNNPPVNFISFRDQW